MLMSTVDRDGGSLSSTSGASVGAVEQHHRVVHTAVGQSGAISVVWTDDNHGVTAVFRSAVDAIAAALATQRALADETLADVPNIRTRIAMHTDRVAIGDGIDETSTTFQRCARLRDIGRGGQTLLSATTAAAVADVLPQGAWLDDLGMHRLADLWRAERVFELRHGDVAHGVGRLRSLDEVPNNLPTQLTSFVGRRDELAAVARLLDEHRLVTLAGSGGCGKSRLAVQVAAEVAHRWPDGVWWVDLSPITDSAMVAELAASTVRVLVEPVSGSLRALVKQLRHMQLLICLDTCEHVLDATAEVAESLLRSCPGVSVLATSREPLGVVGETVWRVPSLPESDAVRLFVNRAELARPGSVAEDATEAVLAICRRLDGIPLAIELAAAWIRVLSPAQIVTAIDDRFRMLAGRAHGMIARHRTISASIAWSYERLDEPDRAVLRRLAVFAGGFSLDAARVVCGDDAVLAAIGRLVDKSLVMATEYRAEIRYRLLDTIRQYAEDRLHDAREAAETRDRHLDHFVRLAEYAEQGLDRDQDRWREVLDTEHDNLRAALEWGLAAAEPRRGRRLAAALARVWFLHGHTHEGIAFLRQAIEAAPDDHSTLQAHLLSGLALVALGGGQAAMTADAARRGLNIAVANDDHRSRARCLVLSAYLPYFTDLAACRRLALEARRYAELAGDIFAIDFARLMHASNATVWDRHDEALALTQEFVDRCLSRGERFCAAFGLSSQVWAALFTGDIRRANDLASQVIRIAEPLGDYFTIGLTTFNLAWVKGLAGDIDAGRRLIEPVVRSIEDAGPDVELVPWLALIPGKLQLWDGDFGGAVEWLERATHFAEPFTDNWITVRALPSLASALRRLGRCEEARTHVDRAISLATQLHVPHAHAEALEEAGYLAAAHDPIGAEDLHHQALAVRVDHGLRTFYVDSLEALASHAVQSERFDQGARVLAASDRARDQIGYQRPAINQSNHDRTITILEAALGEAFTSTWREGQEVSLDDAVSYVTRARGARGRPTSGWRSLTRTELDVVRLVVEGLTNPEIGARLFVSRATVKTHLSHVYAKLNVANRTELETPAAAHNLHSERLRRA
jgi:predicted ATPase/DNA-binding CsgD family transcriptional regulator